MEVDASSELVLEVATGFVGGRFWIVDNEAVDDRICGVFSTIGKAVLEMVEEDAILAGVGEAVVSKVEDAVEEEVVAVVLIFAAEIADVVFIVTVFVVDASKVVLVIVDADVEDFFSAVRL